jgi:hypothetical protein
MKVFVITNVEMGWDCVTGVYKAKSKAALIKHLGEGYDEDTDIIHEETIKTIK